MLVQKLLTMDWPFIGPINFISNYFHSNITFVLSNSLPQSVIFPYPLSQVCFTNSLSSSIYLSLFLSISLSSYFYSHSHSQLDLLHFPFPFFSLSLSPFQLSLSFISSSKFVISCLSEIAVRRWDVRQGVYSLAIC